MQGAEELNIIRSPIVYLNMRDPKFLKYYYKMKTVELIKGDELSGSSPPDIFIGSYGYPNVFISPMVPPLHGSTEVLSTPEMWRGIDIPKIVEYRTLLVRGMYRSNVHNVEKGKVEELIRDFALAEKNVDANIEFARKPELRVVFDENSQPFGPTAPLKNIETGNISSDKRLEKAYSDTDMNATTAMLELYEKGVPVSKIQKALSAGLLGLGKNRKFVPTRWSITAVDDTISKNKINNAKEYESIDSILVYENVALDNRWIILMVPGSWSYELIEAWYPNTTWNMSSNEIAIYSSYEYFEGRRTYAEIGGCYYAARLAVSELFERIKKQAITIILRETHSGYTLPVGVWNVREHVREALEKEPKRFDTLTDAFSYIHTKLDIPIADWIKNSRILKDILNQRRLFGR
ncbi:MAG: Nre family DNA repair protein [Candidatus Micrarchaeota archaeon]